MQANHKQCRAAGFSLIELAIVMIIIGVLISAGITIFKPSVVGVMNTKTEAILKTNIDALVGYSAVQQRLPNRRQFPSLVRSQKDGFGNNIKYIPAFGFTGLRSICNTSFTNLSLVPRRGGAKVDNVAFIVHSFGNDAQNDVPRNPPREYPLTLNSTIEDEIEGGQEELYHSNHVNVVYTVPPWAGGNDPATAKDDIIEWATLPEIQAAAKCGPALRLTTTTLPSGASNKKYSADIFALGGIHFPGGGSYEWCGMGSLPRGLDIAAVVGRSIRPFSRSRDCSHETGTWIGGDYLHLFSGKHDKKHYPKGGTGSVTIFVRDNDGANAAQHHYASNSYILSISGGGHDDEDYECKKHRDYYDREMHSASGKSLAEYRKALAKTQYYFDKKIKDLRCRHEWNWGWGWGWGWSDYGGGTGHDGGDSGGDDTTDPWSDDPGNDDGYNNDDDSGRRERKKRSKSKGGGYGRGNYDYPDDKHDKHDKHDKPGKSGNDNQYDSDLEALINSVGNQQLGNAEDLGSALEIMKQLEGLNGVGGPDLSNELLKEKLEDAVRNGLLDDDSKKGKGKDKKSKYDDDDEEEEEEDEEPRERQRRSR